MGLPYLVTEEGRHTERDRVTMTTKSEPVPWCWEYGDLSPDSHSLIYRYLTLS